MDEHLRPPAAMTSSQFDEYKAMFREAEANRAYYAERMESVTREPRNFQEAAYQKSASVANHLLYLAFNALVIFFIPSFWLAAKIQNLFWWSPWVRFYDTEVYICVFLPCAIAQVWVVYVLSVAAYKWVKLRVFRSRKGVLYRA